MSQLYLEDGPTPIIWAMSRPESIFFKALSLFPHRTLISNTKFDFQVDYMSSALTFNYPDGTRTHVVGLDVSDVTSGHYRGEIHPLITRFSVSGESEMEGKMSGSSNKSCLEENAEEGILASGSSSQLRSLDGTNSRSRKMVYDEDEDDGYTLSPNQSFQSLTAYRNSFSLSIGGDTETETLPNLGNLISTVWGSSYSMVLNTVSRISVFNPRTLFFSAIDKTAHIMKFPIDQLNFGRSKREIVFSGFEESEKKCLAKLDDLKGVETEFELVETEARLCERTPRQKRGEYFFFFVLLACCS